MGPELCWCVRHVLVRPPSCGSFGQTFGQTPAGGRQASGHPKGRDPFLPAGHPTNPTRSIQRGMSGAVLTSQPTRPWPDHDLTNHLTNLTRGRASA